MFERNPESASDNISFPPVDPSRPATNQVFEALKAAILATDLPPGCLISESDMAERFAASRTPVREAFAQLRDAGLVVTRPSRGNYVAKLSEEKIRGAQFVREALELHNIKVLCESGIPGTYFEKLELCILTQEASIAAGDEAGFQGSDDLFHATLASATGYGRAVTVLTREKAALDRLRVLSLNRADHTARLLSEHRAILEAVCAGQGTRASELMRLHLRSVLSLLADMVTAHSHFFE